MAAAEIRNELKNTLNVLNKSIVMIRKSLKHAPSGSLRVSNTRKYPVFYHKEDHGDYLGTYLPRKDRDIAAALAQKDYDTKLLAALMKQQKALERFLKDYDPDVAMNVYEKLSKTRKGLISKHFLTDEEYVEQWLSVSYEHMGFDENDPEFYTPKGERVRSKSEILIADALIRNNIPYRYEYPVYNEVGRPIGVPDFNCLNVRQRKDYYWEHLGKLGDANYANRNVSKLERYTLSEGFDASRLILTFETNEHPLNTRVIEEMIRHYLL